MKRHKIDVRPDRMVVVYVVDPDDYLDVYNDAAGWREGGWRMLSIDSQVIGFTGGASNVLWDSGSGYATKVRYTVLFERVEPLPRPQAPEPRWPTE